MHSILPLVNKQLQNEVHAAVTASLDDTLKLLSSYDIIQMFNIFRFNIYGFRFTWWNYVMLSFLCVSISSLTNNQILQWNTSSSKWVNVTVSTGGSSTLAADTDCSISSPATNQALIYIFKFKMV